MLLRGCATRGCVSADVISFSSPGRDFGNSPVSRIYKVEDLKEAGISHAMKPVKYASPSDSSVQSASGSEYLSNSPNYFDREPGCIADRHPRTSTPIMHA